MARRAPLWLALLWLPGAAQAEVRAVAQARACQSQRDGAACGEAADLYARGVGVSPDLLRAEALADEGCELQSANACLVAGSLELSFRRPERALGRFRKGCELGSPGACGSAGALLEVGGPVPRDLESARDLYGRACAGGATGFCPAVQRLDAQPATPLALARACAGRDADACYGAAVGFELGLDLAPNPARARELYHQACELGSAPGCFDEALLAGAAPEAAVLLTRACTRQLATACTLLGYRLVTAPPSQRDPGRAADLYTQACNLKDAVACFNLAALYQAGDGVRADPAEAGRLRERACKLGNAAACPAPGVSGRR